ncbi:hypothetical protein JHK87_055687 [Glycine soja]|nr:hypothetical protein JHK87_055687 [Glycine soja]
MLLCSLSREGFLLSEDSSPPLSSLSFPFSHCSFLLLPLFFFYSHLNYTGRGRVFPLQEKVKEHIKASIFISKNPRVQDDVDCFKYYAKLAGGLLIAAVFLENLWNFDLVLFFYIRF